MKIYHNSSIVAVLKRFIPHKGGDYLNHLVGIDLQEYPDARSMSFLFIGRYGFASSPMAG